MKSAISQDQQQASQMPLQICQKQGHDQSKIMLICTYDKCQNASQIGCAFCFLDDHAEHAKFKCVISEFQQQINKKCGQVINELHQGYSNNQSNYNPQHSQEQSQIKNQLLEIKNAFCNSIAELEKIIDSMQSTQVNLDEKIQRIGSLIDTNVLSLRRDEIQFALDLYSDKKLDILDCNNKDLKYFFNSCFQKMESIQKEVNQLKAVIQEGPDEKKHWNPQGPQQGSQTDRLQEQFQLESAKLIGICLTDDSIDQKLARCSHFSFISKQQKHGSSFPIFPCCGKVYPCYKCHDMSEFHNYASVLFRYCLQCSNTFNKNKLCQNCSNI